MKPVVTGHVMSSGLLPFTFPIPVLEILVRIFWFICFPFLVFVAHHICRPEDTTLYKHKIEAHMHSVQMWKRFNDKHCSFASATPGRCGTSMSKVHTLNVKEGAKL